MPVLKGPLCGSRAAFFCKKPVNTGFWGVRESVGAWPEAVRWRKISLRCSPEGFRDAPGSVRCRKVSLRWPRNPSGAPRNLSGAGKSLSGAPRNPSGAPGISQVTEKFLQVPGDPHPVLPKASPAAEDFFKVYQKIRQGVADLARVAADRRRVASKSSQGVP